MAGSAALASSCWVATESKEPAWFRKVAGPANAATDGIGRASECRVGEGRGAGCDDTADGGETTGRGDAVVRGEAGAAGRRGALGIVLPVAVGASGSADLAGGSGRAAAARPAESGKCRSTRSAAENSESAGTGDAGLMAADASSSCSSGPADTSDCSPVAAGSRELRSAAAAVVSSGASSGAGGEATSSTPTNSDSVSSLQNQCRVSSTSGHANSGQVISGHGESSTTEGATSPEPCSGSGWTGRSLSVMRLQIRTPGGVVLRRQPRLEPRPGIPPNSRSTQG